MWFSCFWMKQQYLRMNLIILVIHFIRIFAIIFPFIWECVLFAGCRCCCYFYVAIISSVVQLKCANSRSFNMSFSYLVPFCIHNSQWGKYLWYLTRISLALIFSGEKVNETEGFLNNSKRTPFQMLAIENPTNHCVDREKGIWFEAFQAIP